MGAASIDRNEHKAAEKPNNTARRGSHQSTASTDMTEGTGHVSTTASVVTISPLSARTQQHMQLHENDDHSSNQHQHHFGSSLPSSSALQGAADVAGSAPASSILMADKTKTTKETSDHEEPELADDDGFSNQSLPSTRSVATTVAPMTAPHSTEKREAAMRSRNAVASRSNHSARVAHGPASSRTATSSAVDRRLIAKYERVNAEIERVIRSTNAEMNSDNGELLKQVRSELRKTKRNSSQIIQSQKELLEKMERQERGGFRRMFTINREHKMEKLRNKLCEKLNQSVAVEEQLDRLERQSVSLTRMSFGSMCGSGIGMEHDELSELEREREDVLTNLVKTSGLTDLQEIQYRLALFSSEKRACDCAMKQVEQCETLYRKALHLLRIALSTILAPTYSGGLKEFVLGPYPLAVEASQLIEQASRAIQPESRRRYSAYTPDLSSVRPPKFPQQMIDFAKRGTRSNFDPSNAAAIEAMRKLRVSENVVILLQRIVIAKLELIEKWRRDVERDTDSAEEGYKKLDARLQEQMNRLARSVKAE